MLQFEQQVGVIDILAHQLGLWRLLVLVKGFAIDKTVMGNPTNIFTNGDRGFNVEFLCLQKKYHQIKSSSKKYQ